MGRPKRKPTIEEQINILVSQSTIEGRYELAKRLIGILEEEKEVDSGDQAEQPHA
uniref:Uncharacterized protein n=1 Tax=viral metagenome TaxID=1070528 RepID=A0A6M3LEX7_9ZZZZ